MCHYQQWKRHQQWWDFFFYAHNPLIPVFIFSMIILVVFCSVFLITVEDVSAQNFIGQFFFD